MATVRKSLRAAAGAVVALSSLTGALGAQWTQVYDQRYLPASHNWVFRNTYPGADRLFNAFDYGHSILYELLWTQPEAPPSTLEERAFGFITQQLLTSPPRVPLASRAIAPRYSRLAPEALAMFEWAHILHRQVYDILSDERLTRGEQDAELIRIVAYYRSRRDLAFSTRPKSMALMEGQPYSLAFRKRYPKFNGLIWAYHWLQVGLYEPFVTAHSGAARQAGIAAAVARFREMLIDPPHGMPGMMPMTAAIAPTFADRYPEIAIIFDNLHSMHDVISDILTNPSVPPDRKRAAILRAAAAYRDDTTAVTSVAEWREMAGMMGLDAMGGAVPAVAADAAFAGVQARGAKVMGVNQYTSQHVFEDLPDGGRIVLVRDSADSTGVATIRAHLRDITRAFTAGDFTLPGQVHDREVPGTKVMAERQAALRYEFVERAGGGEVRITTTDTAALQAVRDFLAFQRSDHRAPGHEHKP
jgi:hypothetical protein